MKITKEMLEAAMAQMPLMTSEDDMRRALEAAIAAKPKRGRSTGQDNSVKGVLLTVMDHNHAEALLEFRKAKKAPLTQYAAQLLLKRMDGLDANEVVDFMIERNWQGFDPNWPAWADRRGNGTNGHHHANGRAAHGINGRSMGQVSTLSRNYGFGPRSER